MIDLKTTTKTQRHLTRFGLIGILMLAAFAWPPQSDAFLAGAGIVMGLTMVVRRHERAAEDRPHLARRNELTGELLERSGQRVGSQPATKRGYRRPPTLPSFADTLPSAADGWR